MKKIILITVFLCGILASPALGDSHSILLRVPQTVVVDTLQKCLPLAVNQKSADLTGLISVTRIDNLVFKDQSLGAAVAINGRDVELNTSFGGQQIRLNVGNVDLNFNVSALLRYDKASQTLLIRPTVSGVDQQGNQNNEVANLIIALFNDQEIPLPIDNLQPLISDLGNKELTINMAVSDVILKPGTVDIMLSPQATVKKK